MIKFTVKLDLPSADQLIRSRGLDPEGKAQKFHTANVNRRMGKYMPHLSGTLETKLKQISSGTEIKILGPYASFQFHGKVMVDEKTGRGPMNIPGVGLRYKKGSVLKVTARKLEYTKDFNPLAGPYWDRALVAAEGRALTEDLQRFIDRRNGSV